MQAAMLLDPRLAFLLLCTLLLAAAVPLAIAWARLLPEEPPPFRIHRALSYRVFGPAYTRESQNPPRDYFAVFLLFLVTLSFLCQVPGLPRDADFLALPALLPTGASGWLKFGLVWFFASVPGLATVYSFFRPNFLRLPLIAGGIFVLLLWLLKAPLDAAMTAIS